MCVHTLWREMLATNGDDNINVSSLVFAKVRKMANWTRTANALEWGALFNSRIELEIDANKSLCSFPLTTGIYIVIPRDSLVATKSVYQKWKHSTHNKKSDWNHFTCTATIKPKTIANQQLRRCHHPTIRTAIHQFVWQNKLVFPFAENAVAILSRVPFYQCSHPEIHDNEKVNEKSTCFATWQPHQVCLRDRPASGIVIVIDRWLSPTEIRLVQTLVLLLLLLLRLRMLLFSPSLRFKIQSEIFSRHRIWFRNELWLKKISRTSLKIRTSTSFLCHFAHLSPRAMTQIMSNCPNKPKCVRSKPHQNYRYMYTALGLPVDCLINVKISLADAHILRSTPHNNNKKIRRKSSM